MRHWLPRAVATASGIGLVCVGAWAMVSPTTFFEALAPFEPYNQHFLQDLGALTIGLGAVLLLAAARPRADFLAGALLGTGVGAGLHVVSHVIGIDLGGSPGIDIPAFGALAVLLLIAGAIRWRFPPSD
jgi:hypothetical protein